MTEKKTLQEYVMQEIDKLLSKKIPKHQIYTLLTEYSEIPRGTTTKAMNALIRHYQARVAVLDVKLKSRKLNPRRRRKH